MWRWSDETEEQYAGQRNTANQLKTYFTGLYPKTPIGESLKQLFRADPEDPLSKEGKLLREVFYEHGIKPEGYIFPMFDRFELGEEDPGHGYLFEVTPNDFNGALMDPQANSPEFLRFIIPYPPKPILGDATVDKDTLSEWIENRDSNEFFATNAYVPTTSC
ncbi:MAG: hypothetical protein F6K31_00330 [Symploca sp. SIO2G7]|nr:hypothetical protein [Symploca sp. SIO2G7]